MLKKMMTGLLFLMIAVTNAMAVETTGDGRQFDSLLPTDVDSLNAADQAAYQVWEATREVEQSSTYQSSEGPNTMDISSDFSM